MSKILDSLLLKDTKTGEATEYQIQDSQLKARVDNLIANAGNTDDNAELIDIRVGEDGTQYPTAGEAVRGQVSKLNKIKSDITEATKNLFNKHTIKSGALLADGSISDVTNIWHSELIDVDGKDFSVQSIRPVDSNFRIGWYNNDKTFNHRDLLGLDKNGLYFANTDGYKYIRISVHYGVEDVMQIEIGQKQTDYVNHLTAIDTVAREKLRANDEMHYDVCIVGGGAGGVSCAYALKNSGLKVVLVEEQPFLGGTHTQGYVSSLVPAPSPLFIKDVFFELMEKDQACMSVGEHQPMSKDDVRGLDWARTYYHNPIQYCLAFNPKALSLKYEKDLAPYVELMMNSSISSAHHENGVVKYITLKNGITIYANQFIDCTADDVLLSLCGATLYQGGDANNRYLTEYGFTEEHGADENYNFCNAVTLMYRVCKGNEDLSGVTADYYNNAAYWFYNSDPDRIYFNSMNYVSGTNSGTDLITLGKDVVYENLVSKMKSHWKTIKNGCMVDKFPHPASGYKFDRVAPMLGIRESYRAKCERMLHESDMNSYVNLENIKSATNDLDKIIAVGTYIADLHNDPQISTESLNEINSNIGKYGVPYGCIIPKEFKNVLVASRGAGFTHIVASSFRLTRSIMQLGWAAGFATIILNEDELTDYRNVNVEKLQSEAYANIDGMVSDILLYP